MRSIKLYKKLNAFVAELKLNYEISEEKIPSTY